MNNPVIAGFHPDPSVCRVGGDYYLACSSFEYWPGLPIFHSRDLVNWHQIGNALDREGQVDLTTVPSSMGITAPTMRHHEGHYWLACSSLRGQGQFVLNAEHPAGPWSDPVWVDLPGIDPDLAWDDEGRCWFTYYGIKQAVIDPATGAVLQQPTQMWSGAPGSLSPEAPHLYRVGGWWYLMIAEGGTERGHAVSIARGPTPAGPFHPCPHNPILTHRGLAHPIQNTGHGDLVQATDGTWWMVLLGVRPRGVTPGFHVLGRETFLTRVDWIDGWPVVGPVDEESDGPALPPRPWPAPPGRDDFSRSRLGPEWLSVRRRGEEVRVGPAGLMLHGGDQDLDGRLPVFVGRRQQHHQCRMVARLHAGPAVVGLAVRMDERHHAEVVLDGPDLVVRARVGSVLAELGRCRRPADPVDVAIQTGPVRGWASGPDEVAFGYVDGGSMVTVANLDGRYLSTEVAGGFTGRVLGVFAVGGTAVVSWMEYSPTLGT